MPTIKNPRHERFAQALAKGKTADQAYRLAGYKPNRGNASVLKSKESISARVAEILAKAAGKAGVTIETITAEFEEDRAFARKMKHSSAALAATAWKAKLHGLMKEKTEFSGSVTVNISGDDADL